VIRDSPGVKIGLAAVGPEPACARCLAIADATHARWPGGMRPRGCWRPAAKKQMPPPRVMITDKARRDGAAKRGVHARR